MLSKDLYAIRTTKNEQSSSIDEFFDSFEDAMDARTKYANWYRPNGDVSIEKYEKGTTCANPSYEWQISETGCIIKEYDWKTIRKRW